MYTYSDKGFIGCCSLYRLRVFALQAIRSTPYKTQLEELKVSLVLHRTCAKYVLNLISSENLIAASKMFSQLEIIFRSIKLTTTLTVKM